MGELGQVLSTKIFDSAHIHMLAEFSIHDKSITNLYLTGDNLFIALVCDGTCCYCDDMTTGYYQIRPDFGSMYI